MVPIPRALCSKPQQLAVSFAAGYIAGVLCALISQPADNLVSRLSAQQGATLGGVMREMGTRALFTRGLALRILQVGTLTGAQWGIYDAFKVYVGLPTTGAAVPPVGACQQQQQQAAGRASKACGSGSAPSSSKRAKQQLVAASTAVAATSTTSSGGSSSKK